MKMKQVDAEELKAMLMASTQSMRTHKKSLNTALASHAKGWCDAMETAISFIDDLVDKTKRPSSDTNR